MPTDNSMGWTFYGLVEDRFFDDGNSYLNNNPAAYGFSPGEQVQGQLVLSGVALTAYLAALDGAGVGNVTLDASSGVDFQLPLPRVGGLDEGDFTPWAAPLLTLSSQGLQLPLADAQAFLFSEDDPDGPNLWMSQASAGGFFFRDDDDVQMHLFGAWVPSAALVSQVIGGDGGDSLSGGTDLSLLFGRGGDDSLLLQAAGYAWGGLGADVLRGSNGADWLYGGYDNDVISGGGGDDQLHGEGGADRISGGSGNDVIYGDSIWQPGGDDRLSGNAGDDRLFGGWGDDILRGGEGADYLDGGEGNDTADYSEASSGVGVSLATLAYSGEAQGDVLLNIENLTGSRFSDSLGGDAGDNRLHGGAGDDWLWGGGGSDRLYGGDGNDVLNGGVNRPGAVDGTDYLTGGAGSDTFEFLMDEWVSVPVGEDGDYVDFFLRLNFGHDSVLDFNPQEDVLSFVGGPLSFQNLNISEQQNGTLITLDQHSQVFLLGVVADQLNDANLQFVGA
ncbi:calcium-binding protein [Pseudomonas sp. ML96]|uniref:calcium-binding protein n=1 Tax=Pseudomonas sp. ML96 TaxID=1523503 RepID=UPI00068945C2|nr:hypothetical protein [Pseudomonas sp. ML96]